MQVQGIISDLVRFILDGCILDIIHTYYCSGGMIYMFFD